MQDINFGLSFSPGAIVVLRHVFDVACDTVRDQVTDDSKARIHGVVGLAIVNLARGGDVDPDKLLKHALARARAALN